MADTLRKTQILDSALHLADERGLDAVSMRAVADRVGVTPMALYPHIGSKAALLDGIVDRMLAEFLPEHVDPDLSWQDRLRQVGHGARELARRHPAGFTLLFARPAVTDDAVRVVDIVYQSLIDAGVPDAHVPRLERLFTTFCLGFAMSEINGRFGAGDLRGHRGHASTAHDRLGAHLAAPVDWSDEYATDVEDLIALIEQIATASS